jgi:hypothetical protein
MIKPNLHLIFVGSLTLSLLACKGQVSPEFKDALTFCVSFDDGTEADFALGDKNIYTATSREEISLARAGMHNNDHGIAEGEGRFEDAFRFGKKNDIVLFYKSKDNFQYNTENLSGTISFWLKLDPVTDLEPGYTDPIQITDVNYNDAAIWVDFTDQNPRDFRLGIIGDLNSWLQDTVGSSQDAEFERRLVSVSSPPFSNESWTHVVITFEALGTGQSIAGLYLNGGRMGSVSGIDDPFTWDIDRSNIFLGLNFTGLMDELAIFNRALTDKEVKELYVLTEGIKSIM